jgi:uncharacterized protein
LREEKSKSLTKILKLKLEQAMNILEFIFAPWPWYVAGPLIGLTIPVLLIIGNKSFGISSSMRHACAACFPADIKFFKYDWEKEKWNLFFVVGIFFGALIAVQTLSSTNPITINSELRTELQEYGITEIEGLIPAQLFSWESILSIKGFIMIIIGGFMVGFGARYAGGCTSGHAIMGISTLQWPSVIASCCFFVGGYIMANFILPIVLGL